MRLEGEAGRNSLRLTREAPTMPGPPRRTFMRRFFTFRAARFPSFFPALAWLGVLFLGPALCRAQEQGERGNKRPLDFQDVLQGRPRVRGPAPAGWIGKKGHLFWTRRGRSWVQVDAATGKETPLEARPPGRAFPFRRRRSRRRGRRGVPDKAALEKALVQEGGLGKEEARGGAWRARPLGGGRGFVLEAGKDLFWWVPGGKAGPGKNTGKGRLERLTRDPEPEDILGVAPGGGAVLFRKARNLWALRFSGKGPRVFRLTRRGGPERLMGRLDWVYQEEVYGRGTWDAWWFSPGGNWVAFLDLDTSKEPRTPIVDQLPVHQTVRSQRYPKAGDPNPVCRLHLASLETGKDRVIEPTPWGGKDALIVRVDWAPWPELYFQVQDREQRRLVLLALDPSKAGPPREVLREERDDGWVERGRSPRFLPGRKEFLWLSARDGFRHVYRYSLSGKLLNRVTRGPWTVLGIQAVDPGRGVLWFTGTRETVMETHFYRVPLDGSAPPVLLTRKGKDHRVQLSPDRAFFLDRWSSLADPGALDLCRERDGKVLRRVSTADLTPLKPFLLGKPRAHKVPGPGGSVLDGVSLAPPGWKEDRPLPVWIDIYGGPNAPGVRNRWRTLSSPWFHFLADQGILVWRLDPRSAHGASHKDTILCYQHLGKTELQDVEAGIRYLVKKGWADPDRVGITGVSYGGFMVEYALTHSRAFRLGVAVAGVSDWRNYDTIYTERYMRTPQANPAGYRNSSAVAAASRLEGYLFLVHGAMDDNVHLSNTFQLVEALEKAMKLNFGMLLYAREGHGVGRPAHRLHYRRLLWSLIQKKLLPSSL